MPATLESFKKAFARKVTEDQYKGRRSAAIAMIRETEEFVKVLGATDRAKEHAMTLAKLYVQVDDADKLAVKSRDKAYEALDKARDSARTLRGQALDDAKKAFDERKKKAAEAAKALEKSPHAKELTKEIEKAKADLTVAQRLADANRYGEALKTVDAVLAESTSRVKAGLRHGDDPKKSDFEALAKMPGLKGKNRLDELVSELPEKTAAKAYKMAFEVRFGIKVDTYKDQKDKWDAVWDPTARKYVNVGVAPPEWKRIKDSKPNKSLQRMYELFTKVPESHVNAAENPSLKKIIHFKKDEGGAAYWSVTKNIYMNVSRGEGTGAKDQSVELETGMTGSGKAMFPEPPKRDPVCKPINTKVKTPYFDWATLHEVGHAVDDKTGFMKKNGKDAKYGEWQVHGGGAKDVAKIAAAAFNCDAGYVEKKLNGQDVKNEDLPSVFTKDEAGRKLKQKVDQWCADVISGDVWWDGAKSKRIADAIGDGRVYQKAYSSTWNSYKFEARTKGIHGYQFRAAGEWFAELYAAYYSEKLQDAHPFVAELKKLEKPS
jgi:hypothetical protein